MSKHGAKCVVCSERTHRIPAVAVKRALAQRGITTIQGAKNCTELTGVVSTETIFQIIRGNRKQVGFDTADKILCALELQGLWQNDLAEWYFPEGSDVPRRLAIVRRYFATRPR
jgi:hypothetical protein